MSGLEVAAAAVVASQLLDAKYHVSEDLIFIQKIARKLIAYAYNVYRGRASFGMPLKSLPTSTRTTMLSHFLVLRPPLQ